jgi:hypothetical protein
MPRDVFALTVLSPAPRLIGIALLVIAALPLSGCELDDGIIKPPPRLYPHDPTSPQYVVDNLVYGFNQFDVERIGSILHDDFKFIFDAEDVEKFPDDVPKDGEWNREEFLTALENMLDLNFVPERPSQKVDDLRMKIEFAGKPEPTNLEGAPRGTLEGYVTVDMKVYVTGGEDCVVKSRPEFYYVPDSTRTPVSWKLWRIVDAPFQGPSTKTQTPASTATHKPADRYGEHRLDETSFASSIKHVRELSLGLVLAYFGRSAN